MDLILFDVDGTLLDTGGAGRRAINEAARMLYGQANLFDGILFDGATDQGVCRQALQKLGRPFHCSEINKLMKAYLEVLAEEVSRSSRYRVFDGVEELISSFRKAGVLLGLGTGNMEAGARIKLRRGNLNHYFSFGGFGDDGEHRQDLLKAGIERGERLLGRKAGEPWIIGDTPRDYAAARAIGARVILVATGTYSFEELEALNPDICVRSLEDWRLYSLAAARKE
jgi:phosphoglycolate phosphatase-like HAD superfamily hydrolase